MSSEERLAFWTVFSPPFTFQDRVNKAFVSSPTSPTPEGLLVLQQVGDYCFLPGPLSPQSKPTSPGPCPEIRDLNQVAQAKKPPAQAFPQVPAIQLFKALKQQDYLSLPPWDINRPGQVC